MSWVDITEPAELGQLEVGDRVKVTPDGDDPRWHYWSDIWLIGVVDAQVWAVIGEGRDDPDPALHNLSQLLLDGGEIVQATE